MGMKSPGTSADPVPKPVRWVGSSKDDLSALPNEVKNRVGGALWDAQIGLKSPAAKPLRGFGGAGVLEVVVDFDGNTFRTVYGAIRQSCLRPSRVPRRNLGVRLHAEERTGSHQTRLARAKGL